VLPEWLSAHNIRQYHCGETEKYSHVTFFFNGGREEPFALEDRGLVPSPKVATYDLAPEMNMSGVRDSLIDAMSKQVYPFVMCNLASPDMVGHTGKLDKTIIAVTECDKILGDILEGCKKHNYVLIITADHGNAEEMLAYALLISYCICTFSL
jgi:2,3-bisphosphoglycerate-independent phosphoglycerate mutase